MSRYLLLEENGTETRVESAETLLPVDLGETADQTASESGLRDETDTGGLEGAEGNVGEELGAGGGSEVDGGAVVGGALVAEEGDGLLLEELVTAELEGTLEEVTSEGRANTGQKGASTLVLNDLTETTNETAVVGDWVELDSGLDAAQKESSASFLAFFVVYALHWRRRTGAKESIAYTSTGVRPPWVTEQQTAPAKANLE